MKVSLSGDYFQKLKEKYKTNINKVVFKSHCEEIGIHKMFRSKISYK
jgi:hypothetical protein